MTLANRHLRAARLYGVSFVALFTLALTVLLGQLFGAFADSAESFTPYFDTTLERLQHGLGAYLLSRRVSPSWASPCAQPLASSRLPPANTEVQMASFVAAVFASLVGVAAAALATVSLSIGFSQITGDPGIRDGEELLPLLGYVVLAVPAAVSAAFSIWLLARLGSQTAKWPRWVTTAGYVVAVLQLFSFYSLPLFLLPLWVLAASISFRESPAI